MERPLVSIITITYNRADLIHRCIESIQHQTYPNYEHIIVDGNSPDDTQKVVESYNDPHIHYVKLDRRGPQVQMRVGTDQAKGKYVTFLDDDDEYLPEKLEKQVNLFETLPDDIGVVYCWMTYYNFDNREKPIRIHKTELKGFVGDLTPSASMISGTPTMMIRRSVFEEFSGTFDDSIGYIMSDWELLARITQKYKVDYVPESLVKVYVNHGHARLSAGFYQDKARRGILYHNHFLQTFSNVFDRYPERRLIHFEGLYNSNLILGNKKEAWHYYKLICKCKPSGTKRIKYLIKYLIK